MREILFRVKRLDNGEWVEGSLVRWSQDYTAFKIIPWFPQDTDYRVDPLTIGQFTGLTDKNGKKVFEGDRIRYKDKYHNTCGVIQFGEIPHDFGNNGKHIGFYLEWENDGANEWDAWLRHDAAFWLSERECEVIGNIHDKQNGGD